MRISDQTLVNTKNLKLKRKSLVSDSLQSIHTEKLKGGKN